jgi:hypothetical protein
MSVPTPHYDETGEGVYRGATICPGCGRSWDAVYLDTTTCTPCDAPGLPIRPPELAEVDPGPDLLLDDTDRRVFRALLGGT